MAQTKNKIKLISTPLQLSNIPRNFAKANNNGLNEGISMCFFIKNNFLQLPITLGEKRFFFLKANNNGKKRI